MGDGGVACMSLQHNIMERFPIPEKTAVFGGKNANNGFGSKSSLKLADSERKKKKKMKPKKQDNARNGEPEKSELGLARGGKSGSVKEVENGESQEKKDEVEEGELRTLKWPKGEVENGEFVPERYRRSETEKGEIVDEKWRKSEVEAGEFVSGKWRRGEVEKGEIFSERGRKGDAEFAPWRAPRDEIEKGEFIPDRWQRNEVSRDDYGYGKIHRYDTGKNKVWKFERERTPPSGKYSNLSDDAFRRKEFNRSGNQQGKTTPRWEFGQERNVRISSKIVDEEGLYKKECSNGKNHGKEYSSGPGNRLKRYGIEPDINERKHYGDYGDYAGLKSRRLSDDSGRPVHAEHYSRHSVERSYRNSSSSSSSRLPPTDKYSGRHYDSTMSNRAVYDRHGRSPVHLERSPRERNRYYDHRDKSPVRRERSPHVRERSPYDRSRQYDHKNRSQSPQDRTRHHDRRDRTPNYVERSPHDRSRPNNHREVGRKSGPSEQRNSQHGNKVQEDKLVQREPVVNDSHSSAKESQEKSDVLNVSGSVETNANCESHKEESQSPSINCKGTSHTGGAAPEELPSMEEDMDICDTPPHVSIVSDLSTGKWFYLDYYGVEHGPSKLCDLKALVEEGTLMSDHMVKHVDSDRWMTVENAVSPLVTVNFPSIMPDSITQLVSPPEAPGNLLMETGDIGQYGSQANEEKACTSLQPVFLPDGRVAVSELLEDLRIDERIGSLFEGFPVIPGKEMEALGEVLQMTFGNAWWEEWAKSEGFSLYPSQTSEDDEQKMDELSVYSDIKLQEGAESWSSAHSDKDYPHGDSSDWFSGRWSCKGGDWKRSDESAQDRSTRKKIVVNDGFPLCQMPKSGYEDPRWHRKDDLYYPSQGRRLDLPLWAFSTPDEKCDSSGMSRSTQNKPPIVRGVKGTMLSVVRINACVVKDHGSFVSEPRTKVRGKERYSSRATRSYSASSDGKRSSAEGDIQSKSGSEQGLPGSWKSSAFINTPKDRICTVDDLLLHLGEWYYLDGAGHEQGPSSFSELQALADQETIPKGSSVFRKFDRVWVPVTSTAETSEQTVKNQGESTASGDSSGPLMQFQGAAHGERNATSNSFHNLHPQFIGYTLGKLHELVMKSYKTREFAAAVNEALDPWINAKQPKKETEKHVYWKSGDARAAKRARLLGDDSEDEEIEDNDQTVVKAESTFEDLCGDASFCREQGVSSEPGIGGWGILDGHVLARVFHFLRADMKSLAFASLTCKHWRAAVGFYRDISRQVDLSYLGPNCTDPIFLNIMSGYSKDKINSMVLIGCTNITSGTLEEIISSFSCLSTIDIRRCRQFSELAQKFHNFNWIKSRNSRTTVNSEDSYTKVRSLKQITEKSSSVSKVKGLYGNADDFGELKEYFDSVNKRDSANQLFRRSLYKRSKLFDARKSSSILSRDARTRRWAVKKSENGYKRMEEFLATSLKDIMKENTFDFFVPKVAEIQEKMKKGYYIGRGLSSVKEDIIRMCRDAKKANNRGDAGNMSRIITLFNQLALRLDGGSKPSHEKDEMLKLGEDDSSSGFSSTYKYKKKLNKGVTERKYMNRSNGTSSLNGGLDYGEDASDREIRRRLSKLNKKPSDSESETSDDPDRSSEYSNSSESTTSESESDKSEVRTWQSGAGGYFSPDEGLDSMTDDREWGARMTKASLVPPVTRKYEVVDEYVIVADEDDVRRKMQVSLPDDYIEKLNAQKNGIEESDMELPEVKDYKPRKQLGREVIEQEVYGIDPYTHNLLLDSMPEELDWPLLEKHVFIEDVLLRNLNKKVRHFTGTGNTPMMYPLQPVIEEIQDSAEEDGDIQTIRLCQGILRAIDSRTDDKYVAYRKGLGVVCNKEEGFAEDDFVVEFLGEVYPVWKWFEKQDGIRSLQKNNNDPAPEFYNIYLERPKGDADGYDLVVVDAMHKANYASRICHSCRPNCEAKVTAVDGHYQIGIYTVRKIGNGEEITFDYNSVTESKDEYEASVCLCGSQVCRGSYLNLTGEGAFQKVLKEWHGILDRHQLMLEACEANSVSEEDYLELGRAGLGSCLLGGLPDWLVVYSARLVRFINFERTKLPEEILRHNLEEKRKYFSDICLEVEKSDAEVQAEGVYNQRLQNLAVTLDKVRYVMRCVFGDPKNAPPPLERLSPEQVVAFLWKGEGSLVEELLESLTPHATKEMLDDLKSKICAHDPSGSEDIQKELKKSLLWLRDEVRNLPCTYKSRNDAAADLIHIYAYTKCFFRIREYKAVTSPPVYISPLDLGPKCKDKLGTGLQEYCKTYGENYCLGQLIFWHNQTSADPDCSLARASRGCLSLPEFGSFYAKIQKPSRQRVYGPRTVRFMLSRMEKQPQRPWPKDRIWSFKSRPKVVCSPMLDAVLTNTPLDRDLVHWLKHRPAVYQATWDR
ncbi:putative histone-lysine N-methyltransferase [Morus notabilis]|uniref:Putative histone-lysine N-methyltransferase n=1 Tax=Morus notabilis TaxID=981085 RepID=W9SAQ6_9ROSA|nr:histone-lysine N-methyltransferase ATXR3 isoform X2 [Morus notabilis]EXC23165.1 putative histone-lysine N-methyltransferase [Morus notabilis]